MSEFRYLPLQAEALGVTTPPTQRLGLTLADGRRLSALQYGDGAPEVTFLHGAGLNAHTWDTTILHLGRPALAIDLPGHGESSWRPDADYSPRLLAADIAAGISAWAAGPTLLVGHSLGGLAATAVAATYPECAHELIIVDITPGLDTTAAPAVLRDFYAGPTDFASRDELVDRAESFGFGGARADTERGVFFNTRIRPDGRVEWKHHFARLAAQTLTAHAPGDPSALSSNGWEDLAQVTQPTTLVHASAGFVTAADAEQWRAQRPASRVETLEATHNVQESAPDALAALIAHHLDRR